MAAHYHLFDTDFGTCAIAWNVAGLTRMQLPEATVADTDARMRRGGIESSAMLPGHATDAVTALRAYFAGARGGLDGLVLDFGIVTDFNAAIYRALRTVPPGRTTTYGALADQVGSRGAARAVGMAMGRNPWPIIVPCHRVLASGRKIGGFSAPGGTVTKERLLSFEGVDIGCPVLPGLFGT